MRALSIGATGMLAQQTNVEVIANNIANINTTGFKRQRAEFQDLLYQNMARVGTQSSDAGTIIPTGIQMGLGVINTGTYRFNGQGELTLTDNPTDVAINGEGFFQITLPSGDIAYTRSGAFQLNENGELVTLDGYLVDPGITVPQNAIDITINASGEVFATMPTVPVTQTNLGQLGLARFINPGGLQALGSGYFSETVASGAPVTGIANEEGYGALKQNYLENSNVDPVKELTTLITAQRSYEMNSKVIKAADDMLSTTSQLRA